MSFREQKGMASVSGDQSLPLLLLLFLFFIASFFNLPSTADAASGPTTSMKPSSTAPRMKSALVEETKWRRLSSFRICALCTCCGGPRGLCLPSPCCYTINCNIPNRPFGFCSFTPKTCNCFGCHF